ncbi:MAG: hypothetical protein RIE84_11280 [Parvibaculum sp.]|uniref:hypothetical protein n=1 Tax=Parvibaculum sp. TaxID=2024848 RepID=UPI0032F05AF9
MEFRDYSTIFNFLRNKNCVDERGVSGLQRLTDLIQSLEEHGHGRKYQQIASDLPPIATNFGIRAFPTDLGIAKEQIATELHDIKRGRRADMGPVYVAWLWNYHQASAIGLLTELAFDFARIDRNDLAYIAQKRSTDAFLCWSGDYAHDVARSIKNFFDGYADSVSVFLSSVDIQNGAWEQTLKASLYGASRGLLLVTQDVLDSQYLEHEFAILSTKADAPTIFRLGAPRAVLSPVIQKYQDQAFDDKSLERWIKSVLEPKGLAFDPSGFEELLANVHAIQAQYADTYVTDDEDRWRENLARPLLMAEQSTSPFDLEQVLAIAKRRLVLIAQNHWFMTDAPHGGHERFWPQFVRKLKSGVDIEIVAMHRDVEPVVKTTSETPDAYALWANYMEAEAFETHATACWKTLETWQAAYDSLEADEGSKIGALRIYGAYFTPLTMKMVDPDTNNGLIVVSPRGPLRVSHNRPEFVLRRRHERKAFDYFRLMIEEGPVNQGWRLMFQ